MKRALCLTLLAIACGPQLDDQTGPRIQFDLIVSKALSDTVASFQISLLTQGTTLDCTEVQKRCLVDQVKADRFISVQDAAGTTRKALVVPLALTAGAPSTQDATLRGVAPGKDYAVVIEALSKDSPPRLTGSSCNYLPQVQAGTNSALLAATITPLAAPVSCDPRVEK